tara:strand:+ start:89 stop:352 length:264 start_codon:yes stop_codon:yes gene_type:complete
MSGFRFHIKFNFAARITETDARAIVHIERRRVLGMYQCRWFALTPARCLRFIEAGVQKMPGGRGNQSEGVFRADRFNCGPVVRQFRH